METTADILIVDDDESTRQTLTLILGKQGYVTETAGTGQEALAKAWAQCFDLTLLDLRLPDVEGVELLAPLKALRPDMAVLMITGYASQQTAIQALNDGAEGYLTKPVEVDEALAKIRDVLERKRLVLENRRLDQEAQQEIAERQRAEAALQEAVQELRAHMQELAVTEEKLRQQNEELAAAQQILEAERLRYQALFEFAPDGYLVTDTKGTIQEANRAAASLLNVRQDFLVGKPLAIFVAQEDRDAFYARLDRPAELAGGQAWDATLQPRDAAACPVAITVASARDPQGKPVGLRWLIRDITERVRAEEEIRTLNAELEQRVVVRTAELTQREAALREANEKLKELDQLKSQFISNVSHELRTPLTNIITSLYLIDRKPEKHDYYMTTLRHESDLLKRLIEDLLQLSRLDMGKVALVLRPVDINAQVTSLVADRAALFAERGLRLVAQTAPDLPPVQADPNMLTQVQTNLMTNAMNYTPVGGTVTINTGYWILDNASSPSLMPDPAGHAGSNLQSQYPTWADPRAERRDLPSWPI